VWAKEFQWALARHSAGEELIVYPEFERRLGTEGKRMAEEDRKEHQVVKQLLSKLQGLDAKDGNFNSLLEELMKNLVKHINSEEAEGLPKLEESLSREESAKLVKSFERTKYFVPTGPHANTPNKPPFETVAGLLAAPLDKLRDLFQQFPETM